MLRKCLWVLAAAVAAALLCVRVLLPSLLLVRCAGAGMGKASLRPTFLPPCRLNLTALLQQVSPPPPLAPAELPELWPPGDFVVLAASSSKPRYSFYLPLTALVWRWRLGMTPLVLLVGQWHNQPRGTDWAVRECLEQLQLAGLLRLLLVPCAEAEAGAVSQSIRLSFAALPQLHPESWAVVNDADLWPVDRDMYRLGSGDKGTVTSHNAGCCGSFDFRGTRLTELPMGSVGARVREWRELFQLPPIADPELLARFSLQTAAAVKGSARRGWGDDQLVLSVVLQCAAAAAEGRVRFFVRETREDRIDRSRWPAAAGCFSSLLPRVFDAHLPKDGAAAWHPSLRPLFQLLIPNRSDVWQVADRFASRFASHEPVFLHS